MNVRRLRCFVAAADEGNFGRAADRLNIAHSAFSRQISHLEEELGAALFVRLGRRVVLSEAGVVYAARVRPILTALADAASEVRRLQGDSDTTIVLAVQEHLGGHESVVRALQAMRAGSTDLLIGVRPLGSVEMAIALNADQIDLGLAYGEPHLLTTVAHRLVGQDRYQIAMSQDHPLAALNNLTMEDLRDQPFIHIDTDINKGLQADLMAQSRAAGFEARIVQRVPRVSGLVSLLAANIGIAFMPEMIAKPGGIVTRTVAGLDIVIPLALIWRASECRADVMRAVEICAGCLSEALSERQRLRDI